MNEAPLAGRRIIVTRSQEQAGSLVDQLRALGAEPIVCPTIRIEPSVDEERLRACVDRLSTYHWLIFTSANGVSHFFRRLRELGKDIRDLKGIRICAIGPATGGAVEDRGIRVDLVPESFISEGVIEAFRKENVKVTVLAGGMFDYTEDGDSAGF